MNRLELRLQKLEGAMEGDYEQIFVGWDCKDAQVLRCGESLCKREAGEDFESFWARAEKVFSEAVDAGLHWVDAVEA